MFVAILNKIEKKRRNKHEFELDEQLMRAQMNNKVEHEIPSFLLKEK